jgi:MGT family glycosyltransferase
MNSMATYVFLNMPAYGHVNPTFAVGQELVNRGHKVIYYLPETFRETVQATGAEFRPYDSLMKQQQLPTIIQQRVGAMPMMMADECRHVLPQVLDRVRADEPDVIVYETWCMWARIVIQVLQKPAVSLQPTYAMNEHFNMFAMREQFLAQNLPSMSDMRAIVGKMQEDMKEICEAYHVPPLDWRSSFTQSEALNIVFVPKAFQPHAESFNDSYLFVGPSILSRHEATDFPLEKLAGERPVLYISLGTIFNNQPEFFKACFEAFGGGNWQVVLSKGRQVDLTALGSIPDNFLVASYVPQLVVLPRTSVFVTHCGMNSTMESLFYGVPMVAIPQQPEQAMTARRVAEMGLGIQLDKETVNATTLREAVERVAHDRSYYERTRQMQQLIHEAGGYWRAADAIIQFSQSRLTFAKNE